MQSPWLDEFRRFQQISSACSFSHLRLFELFSTPSLQYGLSGRLTGVWLLMHASALWSYRRESGDWWKSEKWKILKGTRQTSICAVRLFRLLPTVVFSRPRMSTSCPPWLFGLSVATCNWMRKTAPIGAHSAVQHWAMITVMMTNIMTDH